MNKFKFITLVALISNAIISPLLCMKTETDGDAEFARQLQELYKKEDAESQRPIKAKKAKKSADSKDAEPEIMTLFHHIEQAYTSHCGLEYELSLLQDDIDNGADIDALHLGETVKGNAGHTVLQLAVMNVYVGHVKLLLENNADINALNKNGDTVLHFVAAGGVGYVGDAVDNYRALVKLLLENNADITIRNKDGKTALEIAAEIGNDWTIEELSNHKKAKKSKLKPAKKSSSKESDDDADGDEDMRDKGDTKKPAKKDNKRKRDDEGKSKNKKAKSKKD